MNTKGVMRRLAAAAGICAIAAASYLYGVVSHRDRLPPYPQLLSIKYRLFPHRIGYSNLSGRIEVPCDSLRKGRTMVALAFGQSNAGNHGESLYRPEGAVFNFYHGKCYRAEDPLLGPTGDAGTVWTRLADLLIRRGLYERVLIIPIAVGSTTVEEWAPGGYLHRLLRDTVRDVAAAGFRITHCFWIQGQSEDSSSRDEAARDRYFRRFMEMVESLRSLGVRAPVYVAVSTISHAGFNPAIQEAQRRLVNPSRGILAGPDYDAIMRDRANRWEEVHLSHRGLEIATRAWLDAILRSEEK